MYPVKYYVHVVHYVVGGQPLERHQPIATAILEKQQNNRTTVSVVKSGVANTTRLDGDRSKDINH